MPKTRESSIRIRTYKTEGSLFRAAAKAQDETLSDWLRRAAHERIARDKNAQDGIDAERRIKAG